MQGMMEVKFKKTHPEAQLPTRKHGNREMNGYEEKWIEEANRQFEQNSPESFKDGYRIGFPAEVDASGNVTNNLIGTGDTGYDIFCVEDKIIPAKGSAVVATGIEVAYISPGYWFRIEARSGLGFKHSIMPHPGIIDNGFRGDLSIKLYNFSDISYNIKCGERIAQLVFYPIISPNITWSVDKLETERGINGFGSTGK